MQAHLSQSVNASVRDGTGAASGALANPGARWALAGFFLSGATLGLESTYDPAGKGFGLTGGKFGLESRKLGSSRMTAKFIKSDPVEARELEGLLRHYRQELAPLCENIRTLAPVKVFGTSGTLYGVAALLPAAP